MIEKIKKFIFLFIPPENWKLPVIIILGVFTGLVIFVIYVGNAPSYLSDKPETCINCHVMYENYASWWHSSHSRVATCNDCHVPQDNIFRKFYFKASDGLRHSTVFTLRLEPQTIRIKESGAKVVKENCKRCHENYLTLIDMRKGETEEKEEKPCWDCHRETPHGKVSSLSTAQNVKVFKPTDIVPEWIKKQITK